MKYLPDGVGTGKAAGKATRRDGDTVMLKLSS